MTGKLWTISDGQTQTDLTEVLSPARNHWRR